MVFRLHVLGEVPKIKAMAWKIVESRSPVVFGIPRLLIDFIKFSWERVHMHNIFHI